MIERNKIGNELDKIFHDVLVEFIEDKYPKGHKSRGKATTFAALFWVNSTIRERIIDLVESKSKMTLG